MNFSSEPEISSTVIENTFPIIGMTCAACAHSVESMLKAQKGVLDANVSYANRSAHVKYTPNLVSAKKLQKVVKQIGYELLPDTENAATELELSEQNHVARLKIKTFLAFIFTIPVIVIGMFFHHGFLGSNYIMLVLTAVVLFWLGRDFFISAIKKLSHFTANMDTLVALSTGVAFFYSAFNTLYPEYFISRGLQPQVYYESAAAIIAFILTGKLLEERARAGTSAALKKLIGLQPKTVRVLNENQTEVEIPIAQVKTGDLLLIRPGEKIPVDGLVEMGESFIDESMITGEPVATQKIPGSSVFAGTINQKGSITLRAQKTGSHTLLAQIIKTVQSAQASKPPVQKLVDKIAGIFVPVVMFIALLSFAAWYISGVENNVTLGLQAFITVLIIACPCALGLATPTAIMVAVGKGAENGILIKDARSLEIAHQATAIVLDKTGTLTKGQPEAEAIIWNKNSQQNQEELKRILLSLELQSEHPLADAIIRKLQAEGVKSVPISNFQSITGKGITGQVADEIYFIGSKNLVRENNISLSVDIAKAADAQTNLAKTVIYLSNSQEVLGLIPVTDQLKANASVAIKELQNLNLEVYLLTGDTLQTANAIGKEAGITNISAEVLPTDKAKYIQKLQKQGKIVAMVGDGINDAPALAQADIGIAMGKGTDIAMDTAGLTLMQSDLRQIITALKLSKATVYIIKQNLFWAFIYNLIGIPIAAGILYPFFGFMLNPMLAGGAMALSSVSVVTNSLRLKRIKL